MKQSLAFAEATEASTAAIKRAARNLIDGAINGDFSIDPLIGADLSKTFAAALVGSIGRAGRHPLLFLADRLRKNIGRLAVDCADHATGDPVPIKPGRENMFIVHALRNGSFRLVTCRRYMRDDHTFIDVDPASIGLQE